MNESNIVRRVGAAVAAVLTSCTIVQAQTTVDSFNPGASNSIRAIALQPDGKILVGGAFTMIGGGGFGATTRNRIARLNADGSVDMTFNPGANNNVDAFAVQSDGKIIVGGIFTTIGGGGTGTTTRNRLARLNPDGSLDTGFNPGANNTINALVLQPDGKILVGGGFTTLGGGGTGTTPRNFIGRLNADGSLDAGFNPGADGPISAVAVQSDGGILFGGSFFKAGGGTGTTERSFLARASADGALDVVFNPSPNSIVYAIVQQPDGRIVVGGGFSRFGNLTTGFSRHNLARLSLSGVVESGFNPGTDGNVYALALQTDGKVVVGGSFRTIGGGGTGTTPRTDLARINADGTVDADFNPGSNAILGIGELVVQVDGKVLVVGDFTQIGGGGSGTTARRQIARLNTATVAPGPAPILPDVSVDRKTLVFAVTTTGTGAARTAGPITPPQSLRLAQTGAGLVSWTAKTDQPWLSVSPASGTVPGVVTATASVAGGLPSGTSATGTITFTFTNASTAATTVSVTLNITDSGSSPPPVGTVDTPADGSVLAGSVAVTGWSLDNIGVKRVELWRDLQPGEPTPTFASSPSDPRTGKIFIANATFVDGARPDVEGLFVSMPFAYRAGWGYLLLTWGLYNNGNGNYKLYAFSFDQEDHVSTIGVKSVTFSNNAATKPFGSIDTPAIGGDASGPNFGWGLTPKVNGVATCKIQLSGVQVSIDSGPLQPVVYGDARSDIAGAFAGFSNTAAAGGHYIFDWSTLAPGPHTIGWLITDDCNRADGVGSRFFNVTGGTSLRADTASVAGPSLVASLRANESESADPITVARGYGELPEIIEPGTAGSRTVEVPQGGRVEIRLPRGFDGVYQLGPSGQRRALPIGSSFDAASGTFYWQPAPGFLGRYRLVFSNGRERISVRLVVVP